MLYNLGALDWQLMGYFPWVPILNKSLETGKELHGITDWLPATVPGGVHFDLHRAGLIPHPYTDMNSLACEWAEHRWWMYRCFVPAEYFSGRTVWLVFKGLDYKAHVFWNEEEIATHEGMFEPLEIDITGRLPKQSDCVELRVLLESAPDEMPQIGKTSATFTQKSRFNYKWDFSTRLVNIGIWDDCFLRCEEEDALVSPCLLADVNGDGAGIVSFSGAVRQNSGSAALSVRCRLSLGERKYSADIPVVEGAFHGTVRVDAPALWYPNGYGAQPLYECSLTLSGQDGRVLDTWRTKTGIRSLTACQNDDAFAGALPYTLCVNGQRIYLRGVNMTPLDHIYGNVTRRHYEQMVLLAKSMHVNLIRVWGGGLIEKDVFYELCDEHGILVWQEFIQSSSGVDSVPSRQPAFLALLRRNAAAAVKRLRSHTCLSVWSGGNELTKEDKTPADCGDENIAMLREIVSEFDSHRLFLPTSASGPREFISYDKGVSHDVHGFWNYMGNPEHYALYAQSDNLFHSEFGCEGMVSPQSLNRFISSEHQTVATVRENLVYRHHGEWWCTLRRDTALFGPIETVREMSACSQWIQAEGLRFILEENRRKKFHNSGSIIWQLNEPWPNVFCTSLVDYYLEQKMAYYWAKTAFAPLAASLRYKKLDYAPGEEWAAEAFVSLDGMPGGEVTLCAEVLTPGGNVLCGWNFTATIDNATALCVGEVRFQLPEDMQGLFLLRLRAALGAHIAENTYYFGCGGGPVYAAALCLPAGTLTAVLLNAMETGTLRYRLRANGGPALHVHPVCTNEYDILCDQSFFTLLPGEETEVEITCTPKFASGFLHESAVPMAGPEIVFEQFRA